MDSCSSPLSQRNVGSIASLLSIGSIASLASVGSIASIGSVGSIASIGKIGAVLNYPVATKVSVWMWHRWRSGVPAAKANA